MSDLKKLEETYQRLSTFELLRIAGDPVGLHHGAIPILRNELVRRNEFEEVEKLDNRLMDHAEEEHFTSEHLSPEEIDAIVKERLAAGESMESISIKLKENGVSYFDDLEKESEFHERAVDQITELRGQGHSDEQIMQTVQETFSITEDEAELLKRKLKSKGRAYLMLGYPLLIMILFFIILSLGTRNVFPGKLVVAAGASAWLVFRGHKILHNL